MTNAAIDYNEAYNKGYSDAMNLYKNLRDQDRQALAGNMLLNVLFVIHSPLRRKLTRLFVEGRKIQGIKEIRQIATDYDVTYGQTLVDARWMWEYFEERMRNAQRHPKYVMDPIDRLMDYNFMTSDFNESLPF
jgi:hypothetical protein